MAGSHVVVARYDMLALDVLDSGCIFIGDEQPTATAMPTRRRRPARPATPTPAGSAEPTDTPAPIATPAGSALPDVTIPPWDGKERLNILLIGTDKRAGRADLQHRHADRRLDRPGHQAGRDVQPAARHGRRAAAAGPARARLRAGLHAARSTPGCTQVRSRSDLFPGNSATRGYNGLKAILGNLYGLDIKYFVEVNFDGFKRSSTRSAG